MAASRLKLAGALGHHASDKRIDLLRRVGEGGSISQAARDSGVSYKAAWQAIDTLSNLAGAPLVERAVGGAGGGGAHLTRAGEDLLRAADALMRSRDQVLRRIAGAKPSSSLAALGLRTSMRNQLPCTVDALHREGHIVTVTMRLGAGEALSSRITQESAELLGLAAGLPVIALCKATAVAVQRTEVGKRAQEPGSNRLPARATRVSRGQAGDEVAGEIAGGLQLVGFAPPASGLRAGSRIVMAMDESAVVIALPG